MNEENTEKGITIHDILIAIKKGWYILLIAICLGAIVGAIYTFGIAKSKYYADGLVSVEYNEVSSDGTVGLNTTQSLRYVNTIGDFLTSETVLTSVKETLSDKYTLSVTGLRGMISATYSTDVMLISIRVTTTNGEKSQDIVKTLVEEICKYSVDSTSSYVHFYCNISNRGAGQNYYSGGPNRTLYMIISLLAGAVLGLVVIFIKEFASTKFKNKEEIESLGYPIVGIKYDQKDAKEELITPSIVNFEPYNRILSNIKLSNVDTPYKVVMITSTDQGELKTTISTNLAYTARNNGKKVCVVDLDIRKPKVDKIFGVQKEVGLAEYLLDDTDLDSIIKKTESGVDVITSGKKIDNPIVVLESEKLKNLITILKEKYDYVIIDTPPLLACSDAEQIAKICDGVIFNIAINQAKKKDVKDSINSLASHNINVIGVNITKVKASKKTAYYNYY